MPRLLIRLVFVLFAAAFVSMIVVANRGEGERIWGFLRSIPSGDKLGHLGLVGALSLLLNLALDRRRASGSGNGIMLGSLVLLVIMTLEEASQAFVPCRSFDLVDGLANLVGVFCGEGLVRMSPSRQTAIDLSQDRNAVLVRAMQNPPFRQQPNRSKLAAPPTPPRGVSGRQP